MFYSYNLDLALPSSGRNPPKPRPKCTGKPRVTSARPAVTHPVGSS